MLLQVGQNSAVAIERERAYTNLPVMLSQTLLVCLVLYLAYTTNQRLAVAPSSNSRNCSLPAQPELLEGTCH